MRTKIFRRLGLGIIASIFYFSLRESQGGKDLFLHADKLVHFMAYLIVTFWYAQIYPKKIHLFFVILFSLMGISLEFLQRETVTRSFDVFDMIANSLGCIVAFLIAKKVDNLFKIKS